MAAKPAPAAPAEAAPAPASSNKLLIIIIALLAVIIAGGAGWFFTMGNKHAPAEEQAAEEHKPEPAKEPVFIAMPEKFTVNLQREDGDQYLQAGITLKVLDPELEPKIKAATPEIHSKLLLLLSSKKASELLSVEGKKVLIEQIIAEVNGTLGITPKAAEHAEADAHGDAHAAKDTKEPAPAEPQGVVDVLFSDFIIQ